MLETCTKVTSFATHCTVLCFKGNIHKPNALAENYQYTLTFFTDFFLQCPFKSVHHKLLSDTKQEFNHCYYSITQVKIKHSHTCISNKT